MIKGCLMVNPFRVIERIQCRVEHSELENRKKWFSFCPSFSHCPFAHHQAIGPKLFQFKLMVKTKGTIRSCGASTESGQRSISLMDHHQWFHCCRALLGHLDSSFHVLTDSLPACKRPPKESEKFCQKHSKKSLMHSLVFPYLFGLPKSKTNYQIEFDFSSRAHRSQSMKHETGSVLAHSDSVTENKLEQSKLITIWNCWFPEHQTVRGSGTVSERNSDFQFGTCSFCVNGEQYQVRSTRAWQLAIKWEWT